jgi:hypothetical protein
VAFGCTAAVEAMARITRHAPDLAIDLSEALLFYYYAEQRDGRDCKSGWNADDALEALKSGTVSETAYPYVAGDQVSKLVPPFHVPVTRISDHRELDDIGAMKTWIANHGPLVAGFTVYEDFHAYAGGVYHHVSGDEVGGHCVLVVGYDDRDHSWICKNSWGTGFGHEGFFRIRWGECGIDDSMWGFSWVYDEFSFDQWRGQWTTGWTSIAPFAANGAPHALLYKSDTGDAKIVRIHADGKGVDATFTGQWTTGWSSVAPLTLGGAPHALRYKTGDGTVSIQRIADDASGATEVWRGTWATGHTRVETFSLGGAPHALVYSGDGGAVAIARIASDGKGFTTTFRGDWSNGWTQIVPVDLGGKQHVVSYKAGDGTFAIARVRADGSGTDETYRGTWGPNWSRMAALVLEGAPHLLSYHTDGSAVLHRLAADGTGLAERQRALWTTGWTKLVPFQLGDSPRVLIYKRDAGTVAIDALQLGVF